MIITNDILNYINEDIETTYEASEKLIKWKQQYHKLVMENEKLVYYVINKLNLKRYTDELYDVGVIGLCKAGRKFDSECGYKFSTYAISCIKNEIYVYIRNNKKYFNNISLDNEIFILNNENITFKDYIKDDIDIEKEIIEKDRYKRLYESINKLDDKEKYIILHLYSLNGYKKMTQIELAKNFKLSQASVSRQLGKILKKLKKFMED